MARILKWSRVFVEEFEHAVEFIGGTSTAHGRRFAEHVIDVAESLKTQTETGHRLEVLGDDALRQRIVGKYRLIYEFDDKHVYLLRLIHAARDLNNAWKSKPPPK